jgi:hypothetical protein
MLLLLIASWLLANFSLVVGLWFAKPGGDLQRDWPTSPALLGHHRPDRRGLDHAGRGEQSANLNAGCSEPWRRKRPLSRRTPTSHQRMHHPRA